MNTSKVKLEYAQNMDGKLVHIRDAKNGMSDELFCPGCGDRLIAVNNGSIITPHFRHHGDIECATAVESVIHLAIKNLIEKYKTISIPKLMLDRVRPDSNGFPHQVKRAVYSYDIVQNLNEIEQEKTLNDIKVDIFAKMHDEPIIIEVFYTHKVDDEKFHRIRTLGITAIELDVSDITQGDLLDEVALWNKVNVPERIKWLYHNAIERMDEQLRKSIMKKDELSRINRIMKPSRSPGMRRRNIP